MKILKKYKYLISLIIIVLIIIYCLMTRESLEENNVVLNEEVFKVEPVNVMGKDKIFVDIKGSVVNPGVYELDKESRVSNLIEKAGGLKEEADTSLINLAKILEDEMVIIIYTKEEVANSNVKQIETVFKIIEKECTCPNIQNDGCINTEIEEQEELTEEETSTLININTASLEELQTLDGIGVSKAQAIITYRETNGNYIIVEDIMKVSGIGETIFNQIKESITT